MNYNTTTVRRLLPIFLMGCTTVFGQETLSPVAADSAPRTAGDMWAGYDPRAEPLEIETLREWEEDGVVLRVVRFRIGTFRGQKSVLAAVYGYPKGGTALPGLVQIHGGGQFADYRAPLYNGQRGYATISIAWAGRISAPGYLVRRENVELFWAGATGDPAYRLTTDWGALDAYHAPCRNPGNAFAKVAPASWTLNDVESPRNNSWFLCALAARRALTFLEQQPEVDADRLGVYGHSMGGKITVLTAAADERVKAAAPSCGGISDRDNASSLYCKTIGDDVNLRLISCPIIFLSPANDFHGRIDDLQKALREILSDQWRITCSAHHNHQDTPEYEVAGPLWFDQHLKGTFCYPKTPETALELEADDGVPVFSVTPDSSQPIVAVDIFYTQQGQMEGEKNDHENTKARFWHHAAGTPSSNTWTARLPLLSTEKPLWVYANVAYPLAEPVTGAGYYYGPYTAEAFNLSSRMRVATPDQLKAAGVQALMKPSLVIETFEDDWQKEWFTYKPDDWARRTHKLYDDRWQAPSNARLALDVRSAMPNAMVVGIDGFAAEVVIKGGDQWQGVSLSPAEFQDAEGNSLPGWENTRELRIGSMETLRTKQGGTTESRVLGAKWQGSRPNFRNLRWIVSAEINQ